MKVLGAIGLVLAIGACTCESEAPARKPGERPTPPTPFSTTPPQREVRLLRPAIPKPEAFLGTWKSKDTTARMRISKGTEGLKIDVWDTQDEERFEVADVKMVEEALHSDWLMPSTNHRTHAALRIKGPNEIEEECTGCSGQGTLSWRRDLDVSGRDALQQPPGGIVPLQNGWR